MYHIVVFRYWWKWNVSKISNYVIHYIFIFLPWIYVSHFLSILHPYSHIPIIKSLCILHQIFTLQYRHHNLLLTLSLISYPNECQWDYISLHTLQMNTFYLFLSFAHQSILPSSSNSHRMQYNNIWINQKGRETHSSLWFKQESLAKVWRDDWW